MKSGYRSTTLALRGHRAFARLAAGALLLGLIGVVDIAAQAAPAEAAGCSYKNLTSIRVYNIDCRYGAYAYRSGSTWYQAGNWVTPKNYSYNWYQVCFQYEGMIGIN